MVKVILNEAQLRQYIREVGGFRKMSEKHRTSAADKFNSLYALDNKLRAAELPTIFKAGNTRSHDVIDGQLKASKNPKKDLVTLFDSDKLCSILFTDEDARVFAKWQTLGQLDMGENINGNKYIEYTNQVNNQQRIEADKVKKEVGSVKTNGDANRAAFLRKCAEIKNQALFNKNDAEEQENATPEEKELYTLLDSVVNKINSENVFRYSQNIYIIVPRTSVKKNSKFNAWELTEKYNNIVNDIRRTVWKSGYKGDVQRPRAINGYPSCCLLIMAFGKR